MASRHEPGRRQVRPVSRSPFSRPGRSDPPRPPEVPRPQTSLQQDAVKQPDLDRRYMALAVRLAAKGRGRTSPNPMVGAVVVSGRRIVGQGYHRRPGGPHAEVLALRSAGGRASGATLYVTLEPCHHTSKPSRPFAPALPQPDPTRPG